MPRTPEDATAALADAYAERNRFYEQLPPEARERFLLALADASDRGLSEADSWEAAVVAAETAYAREAEGVLFDPTLPPPGP